MEYPAPAPANGGKRPRTEMPSQPPQAERKSLGLLARAKAARGLKGEQGSKAPLGKAKAAKADKAKAKVAVERPKDPYLLAEEEELKYLERKLGLTGACGRKHVVVVGRGGTECIGLRLWFLGREW